MPAEISTRRRSTRGLTKPLLSVEETAVLLGESRSSVYKSIERGDFPLPVFKLNGRLRVPRRTVERFIDGEYPLQPRPPAQPVDQSAQPSS